jgi:hypothetical protein
MFAKPSKSVSSVHPLIARVTIFALVSAPALAESDFRYFSGEIDYWNSSAHPRRVEVSASSKRSAAGELTAAASPKQSEPEAFSWAKHMDPRQKEFFREGDYTPPEPFQEIVRNPSDANLKMWFSYIEKRNELSTRLQARMQEYLAKREGVGPLQAGFRVSSLAAAHPKSSPEASRYRLRMYFDSKCPHCHRMFDTLATLQGKGFFVEARQVDSDPQGLLGLPIPAERASPEEIRQKEVQNVPLLLVGDLKKQVIYRISGFRTPTEVMSALSQGP